MARGIQKKRSERMKQKLVTSALQLFDDKGYDNVTVKDIADAAGCTPGNIYHYFRSKEEIPTYATYDLDRDYLDFEERLNTDPEYADLTPFEKLLAFQEELYTVCSNMSLGAEYYIYGLKNPESSIVKLDEHRKSNGIYRRLLTACSEAGEIRDDVSIDDMIKYINIINRGAVVEWILCGKTTDLVTTGTECSKVLFDSFRKIK